MQPYNYHHHHRHPHGLTFNQLTVVGRVSRYYSPCRLNRSSSAYEVSGLGRSSLGVLVEQAEVGGFADSVGPCRREVSLLFIILMLATLWLGLTLSNLTRTPYLSPKLRELLSDYALPLAVIAVSLVGVFIFPELPTNDFRDDNDGWVSSTLFRSIPNGNTRCEHSKRGTKRWVASE